MRPIHRFRVLLVSLLCCGLAMPSLGWGQPFLLDGTHWTNISYDAKVTYVKGVGNMADFEAQANGPKAGQGYCIAYMLVQELKERTIDSVVKEVDTFYKENPNELYKPVLEVIIRRATKLCPPENTK